MSFLADSNKGNLYQREASFWERIMSCFGCCEDDDIHTAPESGNPFAAKNPAGNCVAKLWVINSYAISCNHNISQ